jgi:hypothetical protein
VNGFVPEDPSRDTIAASDGLEGRTGGAAGFSGMKRGREKKFESAKVREF